MAIPELSSKAPVPQIVRIKLEKRDKDGKLIETKVIEYKHANHR